MTARDTLRQTITDQRLGDAGSILEGLSARHAPSQAAMAAASARAAAFVRTIRARDEPGLMELFLSEYGLSTDEGVALMCLAEALLRVPDADTMDALIEDKIAPSAWSEHLGKSSSALVNASTWGLMLTGRVLDPEPSDGFANVLKRTVKRLGEPVIRTAVRQAMREMGRQFVLGETIDSAMERGSAMVAKGYTYSYDMLGEAALTARDAGAFFDAYADAIEKIAQNCRPGPVRDNPGISIKLSALHPRYEEAKADRARAELVDSARKLAVMAREAGMGFNIDAEEADRLDLSLDIIEALAHDPALTGWDGFGVVVQAYGKRAGPVIDWLAELARDTGRQIMVRLVKGAYWDTEIKHAQEQGLEGFPVFTRKFETDMSYICCARKLVDARDFLYPQFATHNAHTVASILEMSDAYETYEFQRLHGMGEALYEVIKQSHPIACRIYAPVGAHRDLLAYLVRRLLENGANSSFVNQIVDKDVPAETIAANPFDAQKTAPASPVTLPAKLFDGRENSRGFDLTDRRTLDRIDAARAPFADHRWAGTPLLATDGAPMGEEITITNPADPNDIVGTMAEATSATAQTAMAHAADWTGATAAERAAVLEAAAELYEDNFGEIFALLAREAGKTLPDCVGELREAVDFLRYYAHETRQSGATAPCGLMTCISPWNFPLAIFTGQIAAALAAGNGVLAKPAEATPLIAHKAVSLMHAAGVPRPVLQLLPGRGGDVGAALTGDERIGGVCFTGSTATAHLINRSMAANLAPAAPLIAETGGLNAMIVDSTALPEQAVRDIIASAFQSAGQRCSALRLLFVQEDIADNLLQMLRGAMDELELGAPWHLRTDIGPVIDETAKAGIDSHIEKARQEGRILHALETPAKGHFVAPVMIEVRAMADLTREIFGPVLHVATFKARQIDAIVNDINASGYGLTFGLHTRIDDRVEQIAPRLKAGNIYVNRNQIGAIVGSQPFGGEGLSGTGPKAGGPHYLARFSSPSGAGEKTEPTTGEKCDPALVQRRLDAIGPVSIRPLETTRLPGPTGESNRLSIYARGTVLCLGPGAEAAQKQADIARQFGCHGLMVAPGASGPDGIDGELDLADLQMLTGFDAVMLWADRQALAEARRALAARDGTIVPLVTSDDPALVRHGCTVERHRCIDTTAAGVNASLLAEAS